MSRSGPQSTELEELRRLFQERTADLQRVKAEYDNYRKRVRRDRLAVRQIAAANVVKALLPVLDAVDRACANEPLTRPQGHRRQPQEATRLAGCRLVR